MQNDAETTKLLTDGEEVLNMTHSKGWGIVRQKFTDKILDLQLIGNVEGDTAEQKAANMDARMMAATLIYDVLKEVTGIVETHAVATQSVQTDTETGFIERA